MRGFVRGFDNRIIAYAVYKLKILPSIVKCQTIVVAGVVDVAGTYGSAVLLFKLLVGYNKFSFYQDMSRPSFGLTGARDGRLVDAQSAGCCSL